MNKITAVIIEDEIPAARRLNNTLNELRPEWQITVLPGSVKKSVEWFAENPHPDLVFLDIQLTDGISFTFIEQAQPESTIIFTTAYDEYAIRAFTVNSIDYLLKPIDEGRLSEALVKYEMLIGSSYKQPDDYFNVILDSLQQREKRYRTRFLILGSDKFQPLEVADIAYFYSENKVTFAVTFGGQEHIVDLSLNKLSEQLDPDFFFRANRQILLCIKAISHIEPYFNGKIVVFLKPPYKNQIIVSEEKLSSFKMWLNF